MIGTQTWEEMRSGRPIEFDDDGLRYYLDQWGERIYEYGAGANGTPAPDDLDPEVAFRFATLRSKLLTGEQLDKLPAPEPLVEDLLMRNSLAVLYGKPGSGKSFLSVDWALCVGTGRGWMGRAVHRGKVLYIAAEGGTGLGQRKRAWQEDREEPDVAGVVWLPVPVSLVDAKWSEALIMLVAEGDYALVVIDTLSRSMPGADENSPRDMSAVVENADRIRRAAGSCVLVVHHTPKSGETMRGHSALEGAADTGLEVKADEITLKLTVEKQKDLPGGAEMLLRLEPVGDSCVIRSHDGRGTNTEAEAKLLAAVGESCGPEGLPSSALLKVSEMADRSFWRTLKALRDAGAIANVGTEGRPRWTLPLRLKRLPNGLAVFVGSVRQRLSLLPRGLAVFYEP